MKWYSRRRLLDFGVELNKFRHVRGSLHKHAIWIRLYICLNCQCSSCPKGIAPVTQPIWDLQKQVRLWKRWISLLTKPHQTSLATTVWHPGPNTSSTSPWISWTPSSDQAWTCSPALAFARGTRSLVKAVSLPGGRWLRRHLRSPLRAPFLVDFTAELDLVILMRLG